MNQQSPANYSYKIVKLKQHQKCTQLHLTILAKLNSLTKHFSKCSLLNLFLLMFLYPFILKKGYRNINRNK